MRNRELQTHAVYHVISKAVKGEFIFADEATRRLLFSALQAVKQKFRFKLYNYCLMSNHIHLMIRPIGADPKELSQIMQEFKSLFAMRYNKINDLQGAVWMNRYFSCILRTSYTREKTFNYIAMNPVTAGMVTSAERYPYGGTFDYMQGRYHLIDPPGAEEMSWLRELILKDFVIDIEHYSVFMKDEIGYKTAAMYSSALRREEGI